MIHKVSFFKFENLTLRNCKFHEVFSPITIFQEKMKISKFFLVLKFSRRKKIAKVIFF
jgi:hypothetical protein